VKIAFDLLQDESGYPPVTMETMWAVPVGSGFFRLDNIPFYVTGVSCFDIVSAQMQLQGWLRFNGLHQASGHSTLRVIVFDESPDSRPLLQRIRELRSELSALGCLTEASHIPSLISVDVPPEVRLAPVQALLLNGQRQGFWDYEEAALAHISKM
jgi:Domain of unknown function (DUF4265)